MPARRPKAACWVRSLDSWSGDPRAITLHATSFVLVPIVIGSVRIDSAALGGIIGADARVSSTVIAMGMLVDDRKHGCGRLDRVLELARNHPRRGWHAVHPAPVGIGSGAPRGCFGGPKSSAVPATDLGRTLDRATLSHGLMGKVVSQLGEGHGGVFTVGDSWQMYMTKPRPDRRV